MHPDAKDFIQHLLVSDPEKRLGSIRKSSQNKNEGGEGAGGNEYGASSSSGSSSTHYFSPPAQTPSDAFFNREHYLKTTDSETLERIIDEETPIFEHPLFRGMDWDALKKKQFPPPCRPHLKRGIFDLTHIDQEYLSEPPIDAPIEPEEEEKFTRWKTANQKKWEQMQKEFLGFDYNEDMVEELEKKKKAQSGGKSEEGMTEEGQSEKPSSEGGGNETGSPVKDSSSSHQSNEEGSNGHKSLGSVQSAHSTKEGSSSSSSSSDSKNQTSEESNTNESEKKKAEENNAESNAS